MTGVVIVGTLLLLAGLGCTAKAPPPAVTSRAQGVTAPSVAPGDERVLWAAASQILERRCVVCHGCYDAPCQLQLGSFEGIERGASKTLVYDATRLRASEPSRLFIDAQGVSAWRKRQFFAVLPESQAKDPYASLLVRVLELKRQQPLPLAGNRALSSDSIASRCVPKPTPSTSSPRSIRCGACRSRCQGSPTPSTTRSWPG
jgi:hypothetical protein